VSRVEPEDMWANVDSTIGHASYYRRTDGWGKERGEQCIALRSDGDRCNRLVGEGAGFCSFHFTRLRDFLAEMDVDRVINQARQEDPKAFRFLIDSARIDDAVRVLEEAAAEVYFIAVGDIVKIGYSKHVLARYQTLRSSSSKTLIPDGYDIRDAVLLGSIAGGQNVEARLHSLLRNYRLKGEWFRLSSTVIQAIDCLLYEAEPPKKIEAGLRDMFSSGGGGRARRRNRDVVA